MSELINRNDVRRQAMDLLSRREHLAAELQTKLFRRFADSELVAWVVDQLAEENLQSDSRFCESYVRQRGNKGYGPQRIRQELQQKGAPAEEITLAFESSESDWFELARATRLKKFGPEVPADFKEKSRQMRFLHYRGFGGDYANEAFAD